MPLRQNRFVQWGMILLVVLIVVVPILVDWIPREAARWRYAAAIEYHFRDQNDRALAELDAAARLDPDNLDIVLLRGRILSRQDRLEEALKIFQEAIPSRADSAADADSRLLFCSRTADLLQRLGRHREAIALWSDFLQPREKEFDELREAGLTDREAAAQVSYYADALNARAYIRARAGLELDAALADVEKAIRLTEGGEEDIAMLDTRGYIHYLRGEPDESRRDLDRAVQAIERDLTPQMEELQQLAEANPDHYELRQALESVREVTAVVYHHAGLVYEKLDLPDRAEPLLKKAKENGYSPERGVW